MKSQENTNVKRIQDSLDSGNNNNYIHSSEPSCSKTSLQLRMQIDLEMASTSNQEQGNISSQTHIFKSEKDSLFEGREITSYSNNFWSSNEAISGSSSDSLESLDVFDFGAVPRMTDNFRYSKESLLIITALTLMYLFACLCIYISVQEYIKQSSLYSNNT